MIKSHNGKKILCKTENYVSLVVPGLSSSSSTISSSTSLPQDSSPSSNPENSRSNEEAPGDLHVEAAGNSSEGLPEWLEAFTENLEIAEMPAAANISHVSDPERPVKVAPSKRSIYIHFPKDQNCEVCKRTKITRAPCGWRTGDSVPRAEKFGDLITADHKVLNEGCESRSNHRYSVVVQDLATQWIQSDQCKTKTCQQTKGVYESFSSRRQSQKVTHTDNSLEFGKSCEDLSWNHRTSTLHRSETNGIVERG